MEEPPDKNGTTISLASRMFDAAIVVDKYYTPLLFLFGAIGNSLSLAVFCLNSKYRSQSASYYLSALSVSDTGYLINLLAVWLEGVYGGVITSGVMCPLVMYLGQVTCFMSVYLTVAFSIERYIAVNFPLKRPRICTRSKARKVIATLTAVALLVFSYAWIIARVIEYPSGRDSYEEFSKETNITTSHNSNLTPNASQITFYSEERTRKEQSLEKPDPSMPTINSFSRASLLPNHNFGKVPSCNNGSYGYFTENRFVQSEIQNCARGLSNTQDFGPTGDERVFYYEESTEAFSQPSANSDDDLASADNIGGVYACSVPKDYYKISEMANYFDSVVTLIIPFFLITFFNVQIALCIWRLRDERQNMLASTTSSTSTQVNHNSRRGVRYAAKCSTYREKLFIRKKQSPPSKEQFGSSESFIENGITRENNCGRDFQPSHCLKGTGDNRGIPHRTEKCDTSLSSGGSEEGSVNDASGPTQSRGDGKRNNEEATLRLNAINKSNNFGPTTRLKRTEEENSFPSRDTSSSRKFSGRRGKGLLSSASSSSSSSASEVRVTKTLLLISTIFVVLNLPAHAVRCAQFIQTLRGATEEEHELLYAAQIWTNFLFNTNFAVNFLLYCASGRNFRQSLKSIFLLKCERKSSRLAWKLTSKRNTSVPRGKRIRTKELHVTEIVELEDRRNLHTYPNATTDNPINQSSAKKAVVGDSMQV